MPELIDVHAHFLTEDYMAAATLAGHERPEGMPRWAAWTVADHLSLMDRVGISVSVLSLSAPGTHFGDAAQARRLSRHVNEFGSAVVGGHPDRFAHLASLPLPDVPGALRELAFALDELGSSGVAVLSNARGVYLGDKRFDELHAELDRRRTTVFVHPVSPPNWEQVAPDTPRPMLEYLFDSARAASSLLFNGVLTRYPNINWIFSHSGGVLPVLVERLQLFRDVFLGSATGPTVAEQLGALWYDIAGTPFPNAVPALTRVFGTDRILYGSDYCWTPPPAVLAQISSVDTASPTWRTLTNTNARRLFPGLGTARAAA